MIHAITARISALIALLTLVVLMPLSAFAAVSDWAENEGGRMRIVLSQPDATGKRQGALEIEPKQGWITYWREPGDAGIPPQLASDPGSPYTISALRFPVPKRIDTGDITDIGYDGPVVLPFTLEAATADASDPLVATAFIGICRNICIPFQANFTLPLTPDVAEDATALAVVTQAEKTMPEQPSADFKVSEIKMAKDLSKLTLTLTLPKASSAEPQIFVTGPSGYVFTDFEGRRALNGTYVATFPIEKLPKDYSTKGQTWGLLAVTGLRAMEAPLAFD